MKMKYRSLKKEDIKKIYLMGKKDFGSSSQYSWDWSIKELKKYLNKHFGFGIVCLGKNKIIGFILVQKNYSSQKPKVSWLTYIFVKKEFRRNKIGSYLIRLSSFKLRKMGKRNFITDVYLKNKSSLSFFKSECFKKKEYWVIGDKKL
jgi:predicted N-acetyltransferase YhbS